MSSLETIANLIENSNPFSIKFVDQQHIWGESFPDVPEINAHISEAVFDAIDRVAKHEIPSIGITITGEKGLGKTQIISRIRHRLQTEGKAFFVYMGNYGKLDNIKPEFLQTLTASLKRVGAEGVTQWQELAANMFFTARGDRLFSPSELANGKFAAAVYKNPKVPEIWTNAICNRKPELTNPYLVKAILWTLSINHAPYATSWLAGQELTQAKADELGLPNNSQKTDSTTFKTACELLSLIANYTNLVLCFDELDDPNYSNYGFTRAQIVAALAKDLRNLIGKCVLLMAMYPATLRDEIKLGQTQGASYDRTADKVLDLDYLNSDTSVSLVTKWLGEFYASKEIVPPHPLYPFDEAEIRAIGKEKPTARAILKWCGENWKTPVDVPVPKPTEEIEKALPEPKFDLVKDAFENELKLVEDYIDSYLESNADVGFALFYAFTTLIDQEIEGVKLLDVEWLDNEVKKVDQGYLHFRISAEEEGKNIQIGVAAILEPTGKFIGAALKRLIDYEKFNFTRGCLVRSHKIGRNSKVPQDCVTKLIKEQGGEWVALVKEDIKPLLAISLVFEKLENYNLTSEQVDSFINHNRLAIDNPLVREILSDPSGQEPTNLTDDELPISIPKRDEKENFEEITL
jgi:hypothetical protein